MFSPFVWVSSDMIRVDKGSKCSQNCRPAKQNVMRSEQSPRVNLTPRHWPLKQIPAMHSTSIHGKCFILNRITTKVFTNHKTQQYAPRR